MLGPWRISDVALAQHDRESGTVPPPLAFRTDAMGIFAILAVVGIGSLLVREPASIEALAPQWASMMWAISLTTFGTAGLLATFVPRRWRIWGVAVEAACRIGLTIAPITYGVAIVANIGIERGIATIVAFSGIGLVCAVAAWLEVRWLRRQARLVYRAMQEGG